MARTTSTEQIQSLITLRDWIPSGSRVFTVLRSTSRSGMRREIGLIVWPTGSDRPIHPDFHVARVLRLRLGKRDGVVVDGCGMDMGFDLVYRLACLLHDDPQSLTHEWL